MNKNEKIAKITLIIFGAVIAFFALINLSMQLFMRLDHFNLTFGYFWMISDPILIIIGLAYLMLGLKFRKIVKGKFRIHLIITVVAIAWLILYMIFAMKITRFPDSEFEPVEHIFAKVFYYLGIIIGSLLFLIPQYIISINLYKAEKKKDKTV